METQESIVQAVAVVYERVKYRNTGLARVVLGRKTPRNGINWPYLEAFCRNALLRDIIPSFCFESMYKDGQKVIPTSPECELVNDEKTIYWYTQYLKTRNVNNEHLIAKQLEKTKENLNMFIADNGLGEARHNVFSYDLFGRVVFPDFGLLVRTSLVSPYLLFLDKSLEPFWNFLPGGISRKDIETMYAGCNKDGRLRKLLSALFGNLIQE